MNQPLPPALQQLIDEQSSLEARLKKRQETFIDTHPSVIALKNQLEDVNRSIRLIDLTLSLPQVNKSSTAQYEITLGMQNGKVVILSDRQVKVDP